MKRTIFVIAAVLGLAVAANAASVTVVSDKATYISGETIVLTVTGDSMGASDNAIYASLDFTGTGGVSYVTGSQTPHTYNFGGMNTWAQGTLPANATSGNAATAFNQGTLNPTTVNELQIATIQLLAGAVGTVNADFFTSPGQNTLNLDYFGVTSAPGTSFSIVPEPTTAALIGLGLFGLALGGRRRS